MKSYRTYYTEWLKDKLPHYHSYLNRGATDDEIGKLKTNFPFRLSHELIELYRLNNGDNSLEQDLPNGMK